MIIKQQYISEIRKTNKALNNNMIIKDLVLSYLLQELSQREELVFKGGTCLTKCYLHYYRISEDLDFTLNKKKLSKQETRDYFKEDFLPHLQKIADKYGLDFNQEEFSQPTTKYCPIKRHKHLFRFNIYHQNTPIKIEINISETPNTIITRDVEQLNKESKHLTYPLKEHTINCYTIEEITLEKIRAIITRREGLSERDFFDLFIINQQKNIFPLNKQGIMKKIKESFIYDEQTIKDNLQELKRTKPFQEIEQLAISPFDKNTYKIFFEKIREETIQLAEEI